MSRGFGHAADTRGGKRLVGLCKGMLAGNVVHVPADYWVRGNLHWYIMHPDETLRVERLCQCMVCSSVSRLMFDLNIKKHFG